jgi:hypothetical protein
VVLPRSHTRDLLWHLLVSWLSQQQFNSQTTDWRITFLNLLEDLFLCVCWTSHTMPSWGAFHLNLVAWLLHGEPSISSATNSREEIPQELTDLSFLDVLNLSDNHNRISSPHLTAVHLKGMLDCVDHLCQSYLVGLHLTLLVFHRWWFDIYVSKHSNKTYASRKSKRPRIWSSRSISLNVYPVQSSCISSISRSFVRNLL